MNIFYLSKDPKRACIYHCEEHVTKMVTEYAQMICTNLYLARIKTLPIVRTEPWGRGITFLPTHAFHPCTYWARMNRENFEFLCDMFFYLSEEFEYRRNKKHLSTIKCQHLISPKYFKYFPTGNFYSPPQAMPEQFKVKNDSVLAYRNFYNGDKSKFATWKNREVPYWYDPIVYKRGKD